MRAAGTIIIASIGGLALIAWGALARLIRDIDEAFGDWPTLHPEMLGVKATVQKARLGGGSGLGQRPSVTIQTKQIQTNSKPRIKSGQAAK